MPYLSPRGPVFDGNQGLGSKYQHLYDDCDHDLEVGEDVDDRVCRMSSPHCLD